MIMKNIFVVLSLLLLPTMLWAQQSPTQCAAEEELPATKTITVNGVDFEFVLVKAGTFLMGSMKNDVEVKDEDETPAHWVKITKDYYIGKTEVTKSQWTTIIKNNPSYNLRGDNLPVESITWYNICGKNGFLSKINYINKDNGTFRLPTEAEWEFAAIGGVKSKGYKYSGSNEISDVAWYRFTAKDGCSKPVATLRSNELGIYDMSGNVWEWTTDGYTNQYPNSTFNNPLIDPKGTISGKFKVIRGGAHTNTPQLSKENFAGGKEWEKAQDEAADMCRVKVRNSCSPFVRSPAIGFRLVWIP